MKDTQEERIGKILDDVYTHEITIAEGVALVSSECERARGEGFKLGQEHMASVVGDELGKYLASLTHTKL